MSTPLPSQTRKQKAAGFWNRAKRRESTQANSSTLKTSAETAPRKRIRPEYDNDRYEMLPMCGHEVKLPEGIKPYPTQKLMMTRILTSLNGRHNVLAESPTGSGKTLALLASTSAWLISHRKQQAKARDDCAVHGTEAMAAAKAQRQSVVEANLGLSLSTEKFVSSYELNVVDVSEGDTVTHRSSTPEPIYNQQHGFLTQHKPKTYRDELEEDFVPSPVPSKTHLPKASSFAIPEFIPVLEKAPPPATCSCLPNVRIYYGTRTHKQIGQVVKEFGRLPYAGIVNHTILASREQSCINDAARRAPDITSYCKELIAPDGMGCIYKSNMRGNKLEIPRNMRNLVEQYAPIVFDVEDLVVALKTSKPAVCPYFTSTRVLTADADIVFCPFNYLIDPIIRNSSDVTVKNSIIILDEAHNIEDVCREAASFTFHEKELADAMHSFIAKEREVHDELAVYSAREVLSAELESKVESMMKLSRSYAVIVTFMKDLWSWFVDVSKPVTKSTPDSFTKKRSATKNWAYLADSLTDSRLHRSLLTPKGTPEYERLEEAFQTFTAREDGSQPELSTASYRPSGTAIVVVEKWLYFQEYFSEINNRSTYRMHVMIEDTTGRSFAPQYGSDRGQGPKNSAYNAAESIWMDSQTGPGGLSPVEEGCKTSVSLWCMTPSITFMGAFDDARSVILASGTLTPIDTLISELGIKFKMQMEGDQVIPKDRIFASVLPVGPSGAPLSVMYKNMQGHSETLIQIAEVVENICVTVPQGILCFVTSYNVMDLLTSYMRDNGMYRRIEKLKVIMEEPRRSSDLNSIMTTFDDVVSNPHNYGSRINGVLMFAVFRGKISEGIDFADDKARVVISIGIPYPSFYDPQVKEKRSYNDEYQKTRNIPSGENWYSTQAYRALNQALGRCLRHRNDWGALVLVDERLTAQAVQKGNRPGVGPSSSARVSKWIREQLVVYRDYGSFEGALNRFVHTMTAQQPTLKQTTSAMTDSTNSVVTIE